MRGQFTDVVHLWGGQGQRVAVAVERGKQRFAFFAFEHGVQPDADDGDVGALRHGRGPGFVDLARLDKRRAGVIFQPHAFGDAPGQPFQKCDHAFVEAVVIAQQYFQVGGGWPGDEEFFGVGGNRQNAVVF